MFSGTYNFPSDAQPSAPVTEPSFVCPADPYDHKRTLQNILPKRGFEYVPGKLASNDIATRNVILDAIGGDTGRSRNVSPRIVDELLGQPFQCVTARMPIVAVVGFMRVWAVVQQHRLVARATAPGLTFSIVFRLITYLVKARLRALATLEAAGTVSVSISKKKKKKEREPSKTALAIDAYIVSLRANARTDLIPSPDDEDDWSEIPDTSRGVLQPYPIVPTTATWGEGLSRGKQEAEAAYEQAGEDKEAEPAAA